MTLLFWIAAVFLIVLGLAGLVLPALPGSPLLFVGLLLAAWAEDFAYVGGWTLTALGGMALLTYLADFAAAAFGAKRFGASKQATAGAALGVLAGLFLGIPGVLIGPFIGAMIGELRTRRDLAAAGRAGVGASLGLALGAAAKLTLGFAMVGIFLVARFV